MDRIRKFIAKRPGKNHRIIEYKNEQFTITKPDMQTLYSYKQNRCLTDIELYAPLNTKWSSETQEKALKTKRKKIINTDMRLIKFREKIRNFKPKPYENVNNITDLWVDDEIDDREHRIEFNKIVDDGIDGHFLQMFSDKENIKYVLKKVEDNYFVPEKKKIKISSLLPKGSVCEDEMYMSKYYVFKDKIKHFSVLENEFIVSFDNKIILYEFKNKREILNHKTIHKTSKILLKKEYIIYSYLNNISIVFRDCSNIRDDLFTFKDNVNVQKSENGLLIITKNKIKDFDNHENILAFISGKMVMYADNKTHKLNSIKFRTEIPLGIRIQKLLYISTSNGFYIYDTMQAVFVKSITGSFSYVHSFALNEDFIAICDRNSRITIYNDKGVKNVLEQNSFIKSVEVHSNKKYFMIRFADQVYVYKIDTDNEYECSIINRIDGKFRNIQYDENTSMVYAIKKNKLLIYT